MLPPVEELDAFEPATIVPLSWKDNFVLQFLRANFVNSEASNKRKSQASNKTKVVPFPFPFRRLTFVLPICF